HRYMSYGSSKKSFESGLNSIAVSMRSASHGNGDGGVPGHVRHRDLATAGVVDLVVRPSRGPFLERDPGLEPGQRRTDAHMDAVPEPDGEADLAVDVKSVGIVVLTLVAVGRAGEEEDRFARWDLAVVPLRGRERKATLVLRRRPVPQHLLDRVRDLGRVVEQLPPLGRVPVEEHD